MIRAATILLLALAPVHAAWAQPASGVLDSFAIGYATGGLSADTSAAALAAGLAVETARLDLARSELRAVAWHRRWRPKVDFFGSVSARGFAFPAISSQGYDPAYAAIAQWPGDTWGVTISWSLDQLLDRRPLHRARADVRVAQARIELAAARREQQTRAERDRRLAAEKRQADEQRRARLVATQLRIQQEYEARRLTAVRELLALAEMQYEQGEMEYAQLAAARLAVLSAEHAAATTAAQLAALGAGASPNELVGAATASATGGR
jgi:hypothetical protein